MLRNMGPNGAGKTSTIRMIYGFSPMTGGSLKVFGLDISANMRASKARIGVCQQENNLDPDLTVLQNLEVFARYLIFPRRKPTPGHGLSWSLWPSITGAKPKQ